MSLWWPRNAEEMLSVGITYVKTSSFHLYVTFDTENMDTGRGTREEYVYIVLIKHNVPFYQSTLYFLAVTRNRCWTKGVTRIEKQIPHKNIWCEVRMCVYLPLLQYHIFCEKKCPSHFFFHDGRGKAQQPCSPVSQAWVSWFISVKHLKLVN